MDDLTAALATSFQVTAHANNPAAPHPRFADYKTRSQLPAQQVRRQRTLTFQKQQRVDFVNHIRCLTDDVWDGFEEEEDEEESMETEQAPRKPGRNYRNQLMLSEWMVEVPEDFETEWIMVPCPVGKRNLVVTAWGATNGYAKSGFCIAPKFPSVLPGGNRSFGKYNNETTIMDCIYHEVNKTFYILDLMCWKGHPIYDSETEFRMFWLHTKLAENPELTQFAKKNKYRFEALPYFPCTKEAIQTLMTTPMDTEMDGLLFYHKRTHYLFGPTPLVVWLKPYMVPEILGVTIPDKLLASKPGTYTNFADHVKQVHIDQEKEKEMKAKRESGQTPTKEGKTKNKSKKANSKSGCDMDVANKDSSPDAKGRTGSTSEDSMEVSGAKGRRRRRSKGKKKAGGKADQEMQQEPSVATEPKETEENPTPVDESEQSIDKT